jgi:hypothetical protein
MFGVLLGGMFLVFMFNNKKTEFCYLPNCRVLKQLRTKAMQISPEAKQKLAENWVTIEDVKNCTTYGDVDFDKSNTSYKGGKLYVVEGQNIKGEPIVVEMVNFETTVLLKDIKKQ